MARQRVSSTISYLCQRTVPFVAGGCLVISLTGNFLELNAEERALLDGIVGLMEAYRTSPATASELTPRELEVLHLLAQGLTGPQIAEQLVISLVTVKFHVRSIYRKLGVTSRAAATRHALEQRLVS